MSTLSWQAGNAADCFLTGTMIQGLLQVNDVNYEPQRWQGTLFVSAMLLVLYVINIWGHAFWPRIQNGLMILHLLAFFAVVTTLWVLAPHNTAKAVFTEFSNNGGWPSTGLSLMVGQISAIYSVLGSDATAHMAEEVRDADRYVPLSLFWSYIGNGIMAIIFLVTYLFSIDNLEAAVTDPSGFPFLYVFKSALSLAGVNALTIIVLLIVSAANVNFGASTARQTFAFARDRGLPFSDWISRVDHGKEIPANAILLSCIISALLSLINVGSLTAFNAIISLQVVSLMFTYACSLSCILYRRLFHQELLPTARWSLGRWGPAVNIIALAYTLFSFFWSFWPANVEVTAGNFNWSAVLFSSVFMMSLIMYFVQGRKVYKGPVTQIVTPRLNC
jgi:amino acid transporter